MAGKRTHAVHRAADRIDSTIEAMKGMRMMPHADPRTEARQQRIAAAAPDIQSMRPHLTLAQLDALAKLDQGK